MIFILRSVKVVILVIVLIVLVWIVYLWASYIDEVVTEGEAYGFHINSKKSDVYRDLPNRLYDMSVQPGRYFVYITVTEQLSRGIGALPDSKLLVQSQFTPFGYEYFENRDNWSIYLEGNFSNSISLIFCDDVLCEIRRHRQYFEFP